MLVDILRSKKGMTLRLCPLIKSKIRNIFWEKSRRKCAPKAGPKPIFILVNNPKQPLHAINAFKIKIF